MPRSKDKDDEDDDEKEETDTKVADDLDEVGIARTKRGNFIVTVDGETEAFFHFEEVVQYLADRWKVDTRPLLEVSKGKSK